jgi:hypothetical protein
MRRPCRFCEDRLQELDAPSDQMSRSCEEGSGGEESAVTVFATERTLVRLVLFVIDAKFINRFSQMGRLEFAP